MNAPAWIIPNETAALAEIKRLSLSEILDRQIDLEKVIALADSDEAKRARVLLRATYTELARRYHKVSA